MRLGKVNTMQLEGTESKWLAGKWQYWALGIVLATALIPPYFMHLTVLPMQFWDEGLFALRAFALAENGELLHRFEDYGLPYSHLSTKPPLITALQALLFKLTGYNTLGLRLPVAVFGVGCSMLVFAFVWCETRHRLAAAVGAVALASYPVWLAPHFARTGDHDVPNAFFTIASLFFLWRYLETKEYRWTRNWTLFLACLLGGFLTKYLAVFFIGPGMLVYLLVRADARILLAKRHTYISVLLLLVLPMVLYYALREAYFPGFFARCWDHELMGRYTTVIDNHADSGLELFKTNILGRMGGWQYVLLPLTVVAFMGRTARLAIYLAAAFLSILVVLLFSQTQIDWYYAPLLPLMAALSALGLSSLLGVFEGDAMQTTHPVWRKVWATLFCVALLYAPYKEAVGSVYKRYDSWEGYASYEYQIKWHREHKPNERLVLYSRDFFALPVYFYQNVHRALHYPEVVWVNYNIDSAQGLLHPNDTVCVCVDYNHATLLERYEAEELGPGHNLCNYFRIVGRKGVEQPDTVASLLQSGSNP